MSKPSRSACCVQSTSSRGPELLGRRLPAVPHQAARSAMPSALVAARARPASEPFAHRIACGRQSCQRVRNAPARKTRATASQPSSSRLRRDALEQRRGPLGGQHGQERRGGRGGRAAVLEARQRQAPLDHALGDAAVAAGDERQLAGGVPQQRRRVGLEQALADDADDLGVRRLVVERVDGHLADPLVGDAGAGASGRQRLGLAHQLVDQVGQAGEVAERDVEGGGGERLGVDHGAVEPARRGLEIAGHHRAQRVAAARGAEHHAAAGAEDRERHALAPLDAVEDGREHRPAQREREQRGRLGLVAAEPQRLQREVDHGRLGRAAGTEREQLAERAAAAAQSVRSNRVSTAAAASRRVTCRPRYAVRSAIANAAAARSVVIAGTVHPARRMTAPPPRSGPARRAVGFRHVAAEPRAPRRRGSPPEGPRGSRPAT